MKGASDQNNPLRAFTQHGRVLVVVSMIAGGIVFYVSVDREFFPSGIYPIIVLFLPAIGGALGIFVIGWIVFAILGIKVWASPSSEIAGLGNTEGKADSLQKPDHDDPMQD